MDFMFDPSLVLYLPLYQLGGASFMSKDAHGHLCTVAGALWRPNGRYFDGTDDKIVSASHAALATVNAFTWEIWLNPSSISTLRTAIQVTGGVNKGGSININQGGNGEMQGWFYGTDAAWHGTPGTVVLTVDNFHHLVVTYDKQNFKEYADGIFQDENAYTVSVAVAATQSAYIGEDRIGANDFTGIVGEARVYNRALTPQEIQHNYLATKWRYR